MKLYPKKLRSLDELEREKARLMKQSRKLDNMDFLSGINLGSSKKEGKKESNDKEESGLLGTIMQFLPVSKDVSGILKDFVLPLILKKIGKADTNNGGQEKKSESKGGNLLKTLAWEIAGGYLKWKAIELSYKGIRYLIKKQKSRKES